MTMDNFKPEKKHKNKQPLNLYIVEIGDESDGFVTYYAPSAEDAYTQAVKDGYLVLWVHKSDEE